MSRCVTNVPTFSASTAAGVRKMAKSSQTNPPTGRLIALNPADPGLREFVLHKDQVLVGSAPTDDLVISDGTVSRHHASVTNREGRYELADLNSTNGTFVNGQSRVRRGLIRATTFDSAR